MRLVVREAGAESSICKLEREQVIGFRFDCNVHQGMFGVGVAAFEFVRPMLGSPLALAGNLLPFDQDIVFADVVACLDRETAGWGIGVSAYGRPNATRRSCPARYRRMTAGAGSPAGRPAPGIPRLIRRACPRVFAPRYSASVR